MLTGGSSSSGITSEALEDSPTTVKARVEVIEKSIGLGRKNKPRDTPKPEDILPGDPKWERIGDRVIRRYKNTNKPDGVWPEVWQRTSHKERNRLIEEAKKFRKQDETIAATIKVVLEGSRPKTRAPAKAPGPERQLNSTLPLRVRKRK